MKRFALLAIIFVFAGCTRNITWVKPNSSNQELRKAEADCGNRAISQAGLLVRATLRNRRFGQCMKEKGFHQVTGSSPAIMRKVAKKKVEKLEGKVISVIDRYWQTGNKGFVLVTLTNRTKEVLNRVRVRCVAIAKDGRRLNVGEEVVAHPSFDFKKPMKPGGTETVRVSIDLTSEKMSSTECRADW